MHVRNHGMGERVMLYILVLIFCAVAALGVASYEWADKNYPEAMLFIGLSAISITIIYDLYIGGITWAQQIFWS